MNKQVSITTLPALILVDDAFGTGERTPEGLVSRYGDSHGITQKMIEAAIKRNELSLVMMAGKQRLIIGPCGQRPLESQGRLTREAVNNLRSRWHGQKTLDKVELLADAQALLAAPTSYFPSREVKRDLVSMIRAIEDALSPALAPTGS